MRNLGLLLLSSALWAEAQSGYITTVAGTDWIFPAHLRAGTPAPLGNVWGVAVDLTGAVYIADPGNHMVMRVDPSGLTVLAGNGIRTYSGDNGAAVNASLNNPVGVALDPSGSLLILDQANYRIRRVAADGTIGTYAGNGQPGSCTDSPSLASPLPLANGIAVDSQGNVYLASASTHCVLELTTDGRIVRFAGTGVAGNAAPNGQPGRSVPLNGPQGVAVDAQNRVYIANTEDNRILRSDTGGNLFTFAGNGILGFGPFAGTAIQARLFRPFGVGVDNSNGTVYIADTGENAILAVDSSGNINVVVDYNGTPGSYGDGQFAYRAALNGPQGVAVGPDGTYYIADTNNRTIRVVANSIINTLAGGGAFKGQVDGVRATAGYLNNPTAITLSQRTDPRLFFDDTSNYRVRSIANDGTLSSFAGNGINAFYPGSGSIFAALDYPAGAPQGALDTLYGLFFTETNFHSVFWVLLDGSRGLVAGDGHPGYLGDGQTLCDHSQFNKPTGMALDFAGNIYIADTGNNRIRVIRNFYADCPTLSTFVGNGSPGYSPDGTSAGAAALNSPTDLAFNRNGNLVFSDTGNQRVRMITADGRIQTVAGSGTAAYGGDNRPALQAQLNMPRGIGLDSAGNLFIADQGNNRIRYVSTDGTMHTLAGTGVAGLGGDGRDPTQALLSAPTGVAVGSKGEVYFTDSGNDRIRAIVPNPVIPTIASQQITLNFPPPSGQIVTNGPLSPQQFVPVDLPDSAASSLPSVDQLLLNSIGAPFSVSMDTSAPWLIVTPTSGTLPGSVAASVDPTGLAAGDYTGQFTITSGLSGTPISPGVSALMITVSVRAHVVSPPALLKVSPGSLVFDISNGGTPASNSLTVSNAGGSQLVLACRVQTDSGDRWLTLSGCPSPSMITAGSFLNVLATANPTGKNPGVYTARVILSAQGQTSQTLNVAMTVSPQPASLLLTLRTLVFVAPRSGDPGLVSAQSFGVANRGSGSMDWTASVQPQSGAIQWLTVGVSFGTSKAGALDSPAVDVHVDASQLSAGIYTGLVRVDAPQAQNAPQFVTVKLIVKEPSEATPITVQPLLLFFSAAAGAPPPGSQTIVLTNLTPTAKTYRAVPNQDGGWIQLAPATGTIGAAAAVNLVVQPKLDNLAPNQYLSTIQIQFGDGTVQSVQVALVLSANPSSSSQASRATRLPSDTITACTAGGLLPGFFDLAPPAGQAYLTQRPVRVRVVDTCGAAFKSNNNDDGNTVLVTFGRGEPQLLFHAQNGEWHGNWNSDSTVASVVVGIQASHCPPPSQPSASCNSPGYFTNSVQQTFDLTYPPDALTIAHNGILNTVNPQPGLPFSPGALVTIQGENLAETDITDPGWQQSLNNMTLQIGGLPVLVHRVAPDHVEAFLPYEIPANTSQQLVLIAGSSTLDKLLPITGAQPFLPVDSSSNLAQASVVQADGSTQPLTPGNPVHPGEMLQITCFGLGAVKNSAVSNPVTATLGSVTYPNVPAQVSPANPGTYTVLFSVPSKPSSGIVTLVVSVNGIQSNQARVLIAEN